MEIITFTMKAILFNSQLKTKSGHSLNSLFSYRPRENGEGDGKKRDFI